MKINEIVNKQRRAADRLDTETLARLTNAYRAKYALMRTEAEALVAYIAAHPDMTADQIMRTGRFKELVTNYENELTEFSAYLKTEIDVTSRASMTAGERDALALLSAVTGGYIARSIGIDKFTPDVVSVMMSFLAPDSALYQRIQQLAKYHAPNIAESLVRAVIQGVNPLEEGKQEIAPLLRLAYKDLTNAAGQALTDALRMARTSQLWAYRESSRMTYAANNDVVRGWYWSAELDDSTCMSCVAQHGTFHTLDEQLDDHYNGRCAMIPAVKGFDSPIDQGGQEWFDDQPESVQRQMMGAQYFEAYQDGAFSFAELSRQVEDDVYGHMHNVTPLYELLGAEPPR